MALSSGQGTVLDAEIRILYAEASGRGNARTPPPRIRKICCRKLVIASEGIYFTRRSRNPRLREIINCEKSQISIESYQNFKNFCFFSSKLENFCMHASQFSFPHENSLSNLIHLKFNHKLLRCSAKFEEFSSHSLQLHTN